MRYAFIQTLFQALQNCETEYVLLKNTLATLSDLDAGSDLDILLPGGICASVRRFINEHPDAATVRWQGWHDRTAAFVFFKNGEFLQLDFLKTLSRKGLVYLPNRLVLANKSLTADGIVATNARFVLEHAILFNLLNGAVLPEKYRRFYAALPEKEQAQLTEFFNFKYGTQLESLAQLADFDPAVQAALQKHIEKLPENNPFARLKNRAAYLLDVAKALVKPRGMVATFSGVDGAGKSTLLAALRERLETRYRRRVVVLRHRPGILPILSAWTKGRAEAESKAAATLPHSGSNRSALASSLRFSYYFLDYFLGQFWVALRWKSRGCVVLYDRYYFDFMADPRRSNTANLPIWLTRFCYFFIQKPELNFFLYAAPTEIARRKKELAPETVERLTQDYAQLFEQLGKHRPGVFHAIENRDLEASLTFIENAFRR